MSNVIDLDILRPEQKLVKLGGHEIDLSFIPCGITFEIDQIVLIERWLVSELELHGSTTTP